MGLYIHKHYTEVSRVYDIIQYPLSTDFPLINLELLTVKINKTKTENLHVLQLIRLFFGNLKVEA